jgi:hypothetical protein
MENVFFFKKFFMQEREECDNIYHLKIVITPSTMYG